MEPSDWVVQPEKRCGEIELSDTDRFCGLAPETALEMFDCRTESREELRERLFQEPAEFFRSDSTVFTQLPDRKKIGLFGAYNLTLDGRNRHAADSFLAGTVLEGEIIITFGIAAGTAPEFRGTGNIILAQPPCATT